MEIVQVVESISSGDGVSNVVKVLDKVIKENQYPTRILEGNLLQEDCDLIDKDPDNIVFYHAALLIDPMVKYLKCRKVMIFHNITFPECFEGFDERLRRETIRGWHDIGEISDFFECAVVFSEFSKECLIKEGWDEKKIFVLPILVRFEKMRGSLNRNLVEKYKGNGSNFLFTGRICPNKRQEDIILAFSEYKKRYEKNSRLFLVGSVTTPSYQKALENLISRLKLEDSAFLCGFVSIEDYISYYELSDVYICMSSHEGFCIPLVEAMFFHKPIIAFDGTAVHDTMGCCGVLVRTRDPYTIANKMQLLMTNKAKRDEILEGQNKRLEELNPDILEPLYSQLIYEIVNSERVMISYKKERSFVGENRSIFSSLFEQNRPHKLVICGAGRVGKRVYRTVISEISEQNTVLCDSDPGSVDIESNVISVRDAARANRDSCFVISVQNVRATKEIADVLVEEGIKPSKIYTYNRSLNALF